MDPLRMGWSYVVSFLQVLSIGSLGLVVVARMLGLLRKPHLYLGIAFSAYILSYLSGFTIGLGVLSVTFIAVALAFAHSLNMVTSTLNSAVAVAVGIATWAIVITYIDDQWIFIPFHLLSGLIL